MDMSFLLKDNHFKLYYTNEIDEKSLLEYIRGQGR